MPHETESTRRINLLIVDDHKMVRDGIKVMLSVFKKSIQFKTEEAENGEQALKMVAKKNYDLVILDYYMPGKTGSEVLQSMLRLKPELKVLGLSNYDELPYIQSMMDAGARGYVLKNIEPAQLLIAIKTIVEGNLYFSNEVANKLLENAKKEKTTERRPVNELTKREIEILKMIAMELTNDEIAEQLCIGKRTVDTHRQNLLVKLHAKNTVGLIKAAYKLKLLGN